MNTQFVQLQADGRMPPWLYRDTLLMSVIAKLFMAAVFGILFICVVLFS